MSETEHVVFKVTDESLNLIKLLREENASLKNQLREALEGQYASFKGGCSLRNDEITKLESELKEMRGALEWLFKNECRRISFKDSYEIIPHGRIDSYTGKTIFEAIQKARYLK